MPRLFVAIDLPEALTSSFRDLEDASLEARWTPSSQYHLTLRFIGDVGQEKAEEISDALARVASQPFTLAGQGLDVFPSRRRPRVLVARIDPDPTLSKLRSDIDKRITDLGIASDRKKFNPHITFARPKASPQEVRGYLKGHSDFKIPPFSVDRFHLYQSELGPSGAVHTVLRSYPLAGGE